MFSTNESNQAMTTRKPNTTSTSSTSSSTSNPPPASPAASPPDPNVALEQYVQQTVSALDANLVRQFR